MDSERAVHAFVAIRDHHGPRHPMIKIYLGIEIRRALFVRLSCQFLPRDLADRPTGIAIE
jgi:hypothetical protein